jgi:glucokinase
MNDGQRRVDRLPLPLLIGDIGGTYARFAVIADGEAAMERLPDERTANHATIDDAIAAVVERHGLRLRSAMLALAGPIADDRVQLTNCDWVVAPKRLIDRFGLSDVVLINDFEAQALSLPGLGPADIDPIGTGTAETDGARVVVGPGTGLGAGALIHAGGMWIPLPGEGGHVDFGPRSERDMAIWPHIERPLGRVEAETVISGGGLLRLYRAICAVDGVAPRLDTPEAVTKAGLAGGDHRAAEALDLLAIYLGRLAGDLAMIFMATGGVYLGGGISAKIAPILKSGGFRQAFVAKPPHDGLLAGILTAIIIKEDAALAGVAAFARAPERFGGSPAPILPPRRTRR